MRETAVDFINRTDQTNRAARPRKKSEYKRQDPHKKKIRKCSKCGRDHQKGQCPAFGKVCHICNKKNHFAAVCKSRNVNNIDTDERKNDSDTVIDT